MDCAVIIPCFREVQRLPRFLRELSAELARSAARIEILVVDDGSGEPEARETCGIVREVQAEYSSITVESLALPKNVGKGAAIYAGWRQVLPQNPALLAFVDADGSVPPHEVRRLVERLLGPEGTGWDALLGSRIKLLGSQVDRVLLRHLVGRVFTTFTTLLTGVAAYDSQCGLKVLRASAFAAIEAELEEQGFVFDVELIATLQGRGYRLREVPIDWCDVAGSKVRLWRDSHRMFTGLLRIRHRLARRGGR